MWSTLKLNTLYKVEVILRHAAEGRVGVGVEVYVYPCLTLILLMWRKW